MSWIGQEFRKSSARTEHVEQQEDSNLAHIGIAHDCYHLGISEVMGVPPPCLPYVSTPPFIITFPSNVWTEGGAGGQARRRKEVSRRLIHYYFWLNETWGGPLPCTSTKQYLGSPKNVFHWGVSFSSQPSCIMNVRRETTADLRGAYIHDTSSAPPPPPPSQFPPSKFRPPPLQTWELLMY